MIDGHIHFAKQDYSVEVIEAMIKRAQETNVSEIYLLDHSHKFYEFADIYSPLLVNDNIKKWYLSKERCSIAKYLAFIKEVKKNKFPIKIKFGLEICYIEQSEDLIRNILKEYKFDFLIGAVHFIDNFAFDLDSTSWQQQNIDYVYRRYFAITEQLIKSGLFDILAHPDSIKLYGYVASYDLRPSYDKIARLLAQYNMKTENNSGLIRYGFSYPGLNPDFFASLKKHKVSFHRSSDAHVASDIARAFDQIEI